MSIEIEKYLERQGSAEKDCPEIKRDDFEEFSQHYETCGAQS